MSEYAAYFFFILNKGVNIQNKKSTLLNFSHSVEELCHITLFEHRDFTKRKDFTHMPRKRIENINSFIAEIADSFKQTNKSPLSFTYIFEEDYDLDIGFTIFNRTIVLSINNNFFNHDYFQETNKRVNALLCFCKEFYRFFAPIYGYGVTQINDWSNVRVSETDQLKLSILYCYNFFGPDLTSFFGMNLIKSIPAWQVEEMNDGGVFLAMEENPISPERLRQNYIKAIELLKIPKFIRAG